MSNHMEQLRNQLENLDFGDGLSRDDLKAQVDLPQEVYLYLPASKRFRSAQEVLNNTGANALARAEGTGEPPDLDMPTEGAMREFGPPGYGPSTTGSEETSIGEDDLPGPENDLGGNSLETSQGRGIPDENE